MNDEQIFHLAVAIASTEEREAYLSVACAQNPALRAEVDSLLRCHASAGDFLERSNAALQATRSTQDGNTQSAADLGRLRRLLGDASNSATQPSLGSFEILEILGSGGMGTVVRARDRKLARVVAIKILNEGIAGTKVGRARFLREARAAAAVKHENVVAIHAVHEEGLVPYLVMEYVEGQSLQDLLDKQGALPVDDVIRIGAQIAAGLDAAHRMGLVHRDVKPANILLDSSGLHAKLTDFGLARTGEDVLTLDGDIAGTPNYMAPELIQGENPSPRGDLFSLGCVLYALCTGRPAFQAASSLAVLRKICDERPVPVRSLNEHVPLWLDELVQTLLAKDPSQRPKSAGEVADKLRSERVPAVHRDVSIRTAWGARRVVWGMAVVSVLLLATTVVIVRRGGNVTRVEVPDDAQVRVAANGDVEVLLADATPEPAKADFPLDPTLRAVAEELVARNPGFDGQVAGTIQNSQIVELSLTTDQIRDLSPLANLRHLKRLVCRGSTSGAGKVVDLAPLRGLPLEELDVSRNEVADLSPLAGMPLVKLQVADSKVAELSPLTGMQLTELFAQSTAISDLSPLRQARLEHLNVSMTGVTDISCLTGHKLVTFYCDGTRIEDFAPLADMPLKILNWRDYEQQDPRYQRVLRGISTLESIDGIPPHEFWRQVEMGKDE